MKGIPWKRLAPLFAVAGILAVAIEHLLHLNLLESSLLGLGIGAFTGWLGYMLFGRQP